MCLDIAWSNASENFNYTLASEKRENFFDKREERELSVVKCSSRLQVWSIRNECVGKRNVEILTGVVPSLIKFNIVVQPKL